MLNFLLTVFQKIRKYRIDYATIEKLNDPPCSIKLTTLTGCSVQLVGRRKWVVSRGSYYVVSTDASRYFQYWSSYTSEYCVASLHTIHKHHGITEKSMKEALDEINRSSKSTE